MIRVLSRDLVVGFVVLLTTHTPICHGARRTFTARVVYLFGHGGVREQRGDVHGPRADSTVAGPLEAALVVEP
eukprot:782547-Prorocentrum_minimum.AAC.1